MIYLLQLVLVSPDQEVQNVIFGSFEVIFSGFLISGQKLMPDSDSVA